MWKRCRSRGWYTILLPMNSADTHSIYWKNEFRWNCFTWYLFTPHAPSTTVAHSEGLSSTNVTKLDLYTNLSYSLVNVHTAPSIHKKEGAAFAETKKLWCTEGVWWRRYEKMESKENPESMETKSKKRQKVRKYEKRRTGEFDNARGVPDADVQRTSNMAKRLCSTGEALRRCAVSHETSRTIDSQQQSPEDFSRFRKPKLPSRPSYLVFAQYWV